MFQSSIILAGFFLLRGGRSLEGVIELLWNGLSYSMRGGSETSVSLTGVGCRVSVLLTAGSCGLSFELEAEDEGIEAAVEDKVEDDCVETLRGDEEVRAGMY